VRDVAKMQKVDLLLAKMVIEERTMGTRPMGKHNVPALVLPLSESPGSEATPSAKADEDKDSLEALLAAAADVEDLEFQASRT